ncbi:MAG: lycopene cyclase family protein [Cyclobacteriaceae bacterium]
MNYDYIVAGAGLGGLSFVNHLLRSGLPFERLLIIDKDAKDSNDRTWSFWSKETPDYQCATQQIWDHLGFASDDYIQYDSILPYRYYTINGIDFYKEIMQLIRDDARISLLETSVKNIADKGDLVEVETDLGNYTAIKVIDSINRPSLRTADAISVAQSFLGWVIETENPTFDPAKPLLMDFRLEQKEACCFGYVLPYSTNEALVEYTQFTSNWTIDQSYFRTQLQQYIQTIWSVDRYTIKHEEIGQIPMTNYEFDEQPSKNVYRVGTAGGDTKPTTGYTFTNVQDHVKRILGQGESTNKTSDLRFDFYDTLLLQIIAQHPTKVKPIMEYLFKNQPMPRVLSFLDEDTNPLEEMMIFGQLPWMPFLNSLTKKLRHDLLF